MIDPRPGVKLSWGELVTWLFTPLALVALLWLLVLLIVQTACYQGSVTV